MAAERRNDLDPQECGRVGCSQRIIWSISETGARLPLNARQVPVYDVQPQPNGQVKAVKARMAYVSHWVSCKNPPHG